MATLVSVEVDYKRLASSREKTISMPVPIIGYVPFSVVVRLRFPFPFCLLTVITLLSGGHMYSLSCDSFISTLTV